MLKVETTEILKGEIDSMIEGAKEAVHYFTYLKNAHKATEEILNSQLEFAEQKLSELQAEKLKKYGSDV